MSPSRASILVCGDFYYTGDSGADLILFNDFLPHIKKADLSIVNCEAPITEARSAIAKSGPSIKASLASGRLLSSAGFNILTLATNHIMDFDIEGLEETMKICSLYGLKFVGVGRTRFEASLPLIESINGVRISILNIAENEFSTTQDNRPGANPLDPVANYYHIKKAKENSDIVIVIVHGGHEAYSLPSPRMKAEYRFLADAGADIIIGHHTHCFSGYESYKGKWIFYSLGNFLFSWPGHHNEGWYTGYAVKFDIQMGAISFELVPYYQNKDCEGVRLMQSEEEKHFSREIMRLNDIIQDDELLQQEFDAYYNSIKAMYRRFLEPHNNSLIYRLQRANLVPSLIKDRKRTLLLNLVRCESHRDIVVRMLEEDVHSFSKG